MYAKQVSAFAAHEKGRLAGATGLPAGEVFGVRALLLAGTATLGVPGAIANGRIRCLRIPGVHGPGPREGGLRAGGTEEGPDSLRRIVGVVIHEGVNIEYMRAFFEKKRDNVFAALKSESAARAAYALRKGGIHVPPEETVRNL